MQQIMHAGKQKKRNSRAGTVAYWYKLGGGGGTLTAIMNVLGILSTVWSISQMQILKMILLLMMMMMMDRLER